MIALMMALRMLNAVPAAKTSRIYGRTIWKPSQNDFSSISEVITGFISFLYVFRLWRVVEMEFFTPTLLG